jgi:hypothetical protein
MYANVGRRPSLLRRNACFSVSGCTRGVQLQNPFADGIANSGDDGGFGASTKL